MSDRKTIGAYVAGEIPEPIEVVITDAAGDPINLTGYQAKWKYQRRGADAVERDASVTDDAAGETTYLWVAADLAVPGTYSARMWVGNGANRFASILFVYLVQDGPGDAPDI